MRTPRTHRVPQKTSAHVDSCLSLQLWIGEDGGSRAGIVVCVQVVGTVDEVGTLGSWTEIQPG